MAGIQRRVAMTSGMPIVAMPAAIDITTTDELREVLLDSAADGHATVVVDMTDTRRCDSGGLSILVGAHRRALAEGGGLRLVVSADGPVARVMDLTGVGRFIPTFSSLEQALTAQPAAASVPTSQRTSPELHHSWSPAEGA